MIRMPRLMIPPHALRRSTWNLILLATLFGTQRHPTQIYSALAALLIGAALSAAEHSATDNRPLAPGGLVARFLVLHGLSLLLIEALRADSLTIAAGLRVTQIAGLFLLIVGLRWLWAIATPILPNPSSPPDVKI